MRSRALRFRLGVHDKSQGLSASAVAVALHTAARELRCASPWCAGGKYTVVREVCSGEHLVTCTCGASYLDRHVGSGSAWREHFVTLGQGGTERPYVARTGKRRPWEPEAGAA